MISDQVKFFHKLCVLHFHHEKLQNNDQQLLFNIWLSVCHKSFRTFPVMFEIKYVKSIVQSINKQKIVKLISISKVSSGVNRAK